MCRYYRIDFANNNSSDAENARFQVLIGFFSQFHALYSLAWRRVDAAFLCRLLSNDRID